MFEHIKKFFEYNNHHVNSAANLEKLVVANNFKDAILDNMLDGKFKDEFNKLINSKNISRAEILRRTGISGTYFDELRNYALKKKASPSRIKLINICLAIDADFDETNHILQCAGLSPLYSRIKMDTIIIWGHENNKTGMEIRDMILEECGADVFDS
ncbi:hypothetical protein [Oribacterium sp. NK2B42]|uniref:hypothetical protein n=1 Tax=Oribacterium sp. NK2B42 TaxID=689781 RepID=UPI0003FC6C23|nr:hypothetical protein [Oribacterium sp. NK2B42]